MRQGGLGACYGLHAAQALVRAHLRRQANLASFLEMCVPSELARGIKLATNLDTWLQF